MSCSSNEIVGLWVSLPCQLAVSSLLGVGALLIAFPSILKVVFSTGWSVSGGGMIEKLTDIKSWFSYLLSGIRALFEGTWL